MSDFQQLHRWAIEVDKDRNQPNRAAQVGFLCDFGSDLYDAVDSATGWEQSLRHVYFTRIFDPHRDHMGAYVRLHFLLRAEHSDAAQKLEERLRQLQSEDKIFQIRMETIDGIEEAGRKGAASFPELYYEYSEFICRTAIKLLQKSPSDTEVDDILWNWTHNFFNLLRGFQVSIVEFPPGISVRTLRI